MYGVMQVKAHSIIIATGATAKRLGIPSEEKFWSQGISACAICDGMLCSQCSCLRVPDSKDGLVLMLLICSHHHCVLC